MLVLYLYTLEMGEPPLYATVNKVCRSMDRTCLRMLGPYIRALGEVVVSAEKYKVTKIPSGSSIPNSLNGNLSGLFVLFKGAPRIEDKFIDDYDGRREDRTVLSLPTYWVCTEKLQLGVRDALLLDVNQSNDMLPSNNYTPVLFVISIQNYNGFSGIRLDSKACTAYPDLKEVILSKGARVQVIALERNRTINVANSSQ